MPIFFKRVLIILLILVPASLFAQVNSNKVIASFLYNFTEFTEWKNRKETIICVSNDDDVLDILELLSSKTNKFRVKSKRSNSNFDECSLIYIGDLSLKLIEDIISKLKSDTIITSSKDYSKLGTDIRFYIDKKGKVKLKGYKNLLEKNKVVVDSELLEIIDFN